MPSSTAKTPAPGQGGFSLLSTLVAVGLAGLLAVVIAAQLAQLNAVTIGTAQRDRKTSLRKLVRNEASCATTVAQYGTGCVGVPRQPVLNADGAPLGPRVPGQTMWRPQGYDYGIWTTCAVVRGRRTLQVWAVPLTKQGAIAQDPTRQVPWTPAPLFEPADVTCEGPFAAAAAGNGASCVGAESIGGFCSYSRTCATGGGSCTASCNPGDVLMSCNFNAVSWRNVRSFSPGLPARCTCDLGSTGGTCIAYCARPN